MNILIVSIKTILNNHGSNLLGGAKNPRSSERGFSFVPKPQHHFLFVRTQMNEVALHANRLTKKFVYAIIIEKGGVAMEKIIHYENLRNFAYSNDKLIKGEIKGIVLNFYGLGGMTIHNTDPGDAIEYAEKGIVYVIPYYNPWCWMNKQAVAYVDEIIEVLCAKYHLDNSVKIVSTGGSMGGLSALVYCAYAKITPCACVTNCPVCDLVYHYTERPDLPRTLYSAFGVYEGTMEDALKSCSPLHLVEKMPHIPYTIFHCKEDLSVNLEKHSRKFVGAMQSAHRIELKKVPFRGHCDLSAEARVEYMDCIVKSI